MQNASQPPFLHLDIKKQEAESSSVSFYHVWAANYFFLDLC